MPVRLPRRPAVLSRRGTSRRRVFTTAVTTVLVGGTFAGLLSVTTAPDSSAAASVPLPSRAPAETPVKVRGVEAPAGADGASVVQIVAHPDDDLFFMNPDTSQSIHSGNPLTSVYLTSGESDGVNARPRDAAGAQPDKAGYAEAR
ncbi:PIG-L family deacetylase, partial [Streptomyces narbonensis]